MNTLSLCSIYTHYYSPPPFYPTTPNLTLHSLCLSYPNTRSHSSNNIKILHSSYLYPIMSLFFSTSMLYKPNRTFHSTTFILKGSKALIHLFNHYLKNISYFYPFFIYSSQIYHYLYYIHNLYFYIIRIFNPSIYL